MKKLSEMTPYQLGESNKKEAVEYLIKYFEKGKDKDIKLSVSAINKLSKKYPTETKKAISYIVDNLNNRESQIREIAMKTLSNFELDKEILDVIKKIKDEDEKEYNRKIANSILKKNQNKFKTDDLNITKENGNNTVDKKNNSDEQERIQDSILLKKQRSKPLYIKQTNGVDRYSANYSYTNHNFVIQNNKGSINKNNKYFPVICILKNILMRGCPTIMSDYLQKNIGMIHNREDFKKEYVLISNIEPEWYKTIKGDEFNNDYPAKVFFDEIIEEYLPDYKFIKQLILPEASFYDITLNLDKNYSYQKVDFYLPQANLVIEIDGQQHKNDDNTRITDKERDRYLNKFGVKTIRINTHDINNKTKVLKEKMKSIKIYLDKNGSNLKNYKEAYNKKICIEPGKSEIFYKAATVIRFQILILSLLEKGKLKLDNDIWNLSVIERDISNFEELAIEDLFIWLKHLCKLNKLDFNKPKINLKIVKGEYLFYSNDYINIDFSLFQRWTDENKLKQNKEYIYIRTDYIDNCTHFRVSTHELIKYNINIVDESSDKESLLFLLKNIFEFEKFNLGQLPAIINSLEGNDTIGLLPTGGGKSLIYQFVGLLQPSINFVVAPIKSLMKDQMVNLDKKYITNTNYINSNQTAEEKEIVQRDFGNKRYQFVWISPERFQTEKFRSQLKSINSKSVIGLAVIDEVHCLSEWGHDFRTSYLNLAKTINKYCSKSRILGLTATASEYVLKDILREFEIAKENVKTLPSFTREELTFKVIKDDGGKGKKLNNLKKLLNRLNKHRNIFSEENDHKMPGIIFTQFVNYGELGCYKLSKELKEVFDSDIRWYSGSCPEEKITIKENNNEVDGNKYYRKSKKKRIRIMDETSLNEYKDKTQDDFQDNKFPLLVSTKAFGMGIDKSNIRYTIHHGMPNSLEALYQEAGRAGRDRKKSACYILFSDEKVGLKKIDNIFNKDIEVRQINAIQDEVEYDGRDAFNNMFLWLTGVRDIEEETKDLLRLYNPKYKNTNVLLEGKKLYMSKHNLEKSIYKLRLIGIVDDWIIKDWSEYNSKILVFFKDFNNRSIKESLLNYIKKYDPEFIFEKDNLYNNIINSSEYDFIEKIIRILLHWQYKNIAYHRRESIKTVYDLCKNYKDPDEFKEYIESYFRFNDTTYNFDYISQYPTDYKYWFQAFYNKDGEYLEKNEYISNIATLRRFLESYKNNTGLNYISGLLYLIADDFENDDGRDRFIEALNNIKNFKLGERIDILENTLKLGKILDEKNKQILSKLLIEENKGHHKKIYMELEDEYSLKYLLGISLNRIQEARREIN